MALRSQKRMEVLAWSRRASYTGYVLVTDHSWVRGNKPLAIVGPDYFMIAVAPSLEASSPAVGVPTVQSW